MKSKIFLLVIATVAFSGCNKAQNATGSPTKKSEKVNASPQKKSTSQSAYKWFDTTWFEIEYPATFTAKGSLKSSTSTEGFDSAVFMSPDGKVQFYIFSPQWHGDYKDITLNSKTEIESARTHEKKGDTIITRWTIAAKDGSYKRSYEEMNFGSTINRVFGIKYASETDRKRYLPAYLRFKKSLLQYAD